MTKWTRRAGLALALVTPPVVGWPAVRWAIGPSVPPVSARSQQHLANVRILRDQFGVPHVFGHTDADAAFGLAYAHAEDDWPMIQGVLAASRGRLGMLKPGQQALSNDFYAAFVGVEAELQATWGDAPPELVAVFDAYAEGLNTYAAHHPDEVEPRLLPFEGKDVAAGFVHKLPYMMKMDKVMKALVEGERHVEAVVFPGSNAQAVHRTRSTDDVTRLNVNAHQPWKGPVTFYEAHVHSDEGWNMSGGLFPGSPFVLHGHNDHVGWAMTVNKPDGIDLYELEIEGDRYRWGDGWADLTSETAWLPYTTWWGTIPIPQTIRRSAHGPVFEKGPFPVAIKHSGEGQGIRAALQWYRMNKATSFEELQAALQTHAIPMFNITYASRDHIGFLYNGRIPERNDGFDWEELLPGSDPAALWTSMLPLDVHPAVVDPESGYVQACNSAPWLATVGPDAPTPTPALANAGIESVVTNRTHRTHELFADGAPISREAFLAMKWDPGTSDDSALHRKLLAPLRAATFEEPDAAEVQRRLLEWDGRFVEGSVGAALATLTWRPLVGPGDDVLPGYVLEDAVRNTARHLREHFGRLDVPLEEVQRLRRGDVDLPLVGGPDTLHCTYTDFDGAHLVGHTGDGYVMDVEFREGGVRSWSIHQYGAAPGRPESPHHTDQAHLFVKKRMKPVLRDEADIRGFLLAEYTPGEPWTPSTDDPFARLERAEHVAEGW
ncbi:MAG: penicillin acylase family protein [Alphaproteobacteria bacterium]|nr:penicillin acylase family protein [Alphaproteobacteria bacterium]